MQAEAAAKLQEQHRQDAAKLRRERDVLDRQMAALTKMPTQKERREVCCLGSGTASHCRVFPDMFITSGDIYETGWTLRASICLGRIPSV